jgi:hypothetical protein
MESNDIGQAQPERHIQRTRMPGLPLVRPFLQQGEQTGQPQVIAYYFTNHHPNYYTLLLHQTTYRLCRLWLTSWMLVEWQSQ